MMSLETMQREMAGAVMMPLTSDDRMRRTAADGRPMTEIADSFVSANSRMTAFDRLEIYNRQYWFRVLDALREDFSALAAVIGERRFTALAVAYLTAWPSRSYTLRNLGRKMVEWIEEHPEYAGRRTALAADVARVEWAHVEAFDGAEYAPLNAQEEIGGGSRLRLQAHLRLLTLRYPLDELVIELHRRDRDDATAPVAAPRTRRQWLAVHRVEHSVYYRRLEREEFSILCSLEQGYTVSEALTSAFSGSRIAESERPGRLRFWFAQWAELGWLCMPDAVEARESRR